MIRSPNNTPSHLTMDLRSGASIPYDLHSNYVLKDHTLQLLDRNSVPLRLTRNIRELIGELGVNGPFKYAVGTYALVG